MTKLTGKPLVFLVLCACLISTTHTLFAPPTSVVAVVTFTGVATVQGGSSYVSPYVVYTAPTKVKVDTKFLLAALGAAGANSPLPGFPADAKLVLTGTGSMPAFQVWSRENTFLADVSSFMYLTEVDAGSIWVGKINPINDLGAPTYTQNMNVSFFFNAITGGTGLMFKLQGLASHVTTDGQINATTHLYKETSSFASKYLSGYGSYQTSPILMTGNLKAVGTAPLPAP